MLVGEKTDGCGTGLDVMQRKRIRVALALEPFKAYWSRDAPAV